jgi:hypothetical protein
MSQEAIKQCCTGDPVWIFAYSDGSFLLICDNDLKNPIYNIGATEIINIKTKESFSPQIILGDSKIGKF